MPAKSALRGGSLAARRAKAFGVKKRVPLSLVDPQTGSRLAVTVEVEGSAIAILPAGYSTFGEPQGAGSPLYLEYYQGALTLHVWADITQEDTTHRIPLSGAREERRATMSRRRRGSSS